MTRPFPRFKQSLHSSLSANNNSLLEFHVCITFSILFPPLEYTIYSQFCLDVIYQKRKVCSFSARKKTNSRVSWSISYGHLVFHGNISNLWRHSLQAFSSPAMYWNINWIFLHFYSNAFRYQPFFCCLTFNLYIYSDVKHILAMHFFQKPILMLSHIGVPNLGLVYNFNASKIDWKLN